MHKRPGSLPVLCGLLLLAIAFSAAAAAAPFWPAQASSDSKSDCSKQSGTDKEKSTDCDNISGGRMSTKLKTKNKTASKASDSAAASSMGKTSSSSASKASEKEEKSDSKKEADAISKERMSTRGLNPPKDAAKDQTAKPDASANPK
jgi:hypothetical protein